MSSYKTPEWVKYPQDRVTLDDTGAGKVTGPVVITWTEADSAFVRTDAHHNDDRACITFRNREWLADAHVERDESGRWKLGEYTTRSDYAVSERGNFGGSAPRTFRAAILEAMRESVQRHADASRLGEAERASAAQSLVSLDRERDETEAKLREIDSKRAVCLATLGLHDERITD